MDNKLIAKDNDGKIVKFDTSFVYLVIPNVNNCHGKN